MSATTTDVHLVMSPRTRQQMIAEMAADFHFDTARAIVRAFSDHTGMSCEQAADIMIDAWKGSKERTSEEMERDALCFEKIIMYP